MTEWAVEGDRLSLKKVEHVRDSESGYGQSEFMKLSEKNERRRGF
jgi:hypothetical protein